MRAGPVTELLEVIPNASSCSTAFAGIIAPCLRSASTAGASCLGFFPANAPVPPVVARFFVSILSFRTNGSPSSGRASLSFLRLSDAAASNL